MPLFQITPTRPLAFLLDRVIEAVPTRAWTTLLWAAAYSAIIPGRARWLAVALLWAVGVATGMLAHLARLLVLGGLPGLALGLGLLFRPQWVEDLYRHGLYRVVELGEQDTDRPGRSYWLPRRTDGVLRAVLSREWLQLARSKMARMQLLIFVAGTVGVFLAGRSPEGAPMQRLVRYVGSLSLLAWFNAFGHWVVRVFEQERVTVALYRLAAVPIPKLVAAKLTSIAVPSGVLVAIATTAGSLAARLAPADALGVLFWSELALAAGVMGGFGVAAATADQEPEEPEAAAAPRNELSGSATVQTNAWFALARVGGLAVSTALSLWAGAVRPWLAAPPAVAWALALGLPLALLVGGVSWMLRTWRT